VTRMLVFFLNFLLASFGPRWRTGFFWAMG
jgi:hypothetical protein